MSPVRRKRGGLSSQTSRGATSGMVSKDVIPPDSPSKLRPLATPSTNTAGNERGGLDKLDATTSIHDAGVRRIKARSHSRGRAEVAAVVGGRDEELHQAQARVHVHMERSGESNIGGVGNRHSFQRRTSSEEYEYSDEERRRRNGRMPRYFPGGEDLDWDGEDSVDLERSNRRGRGHLRSRSEGSSSYASGSFVTSDYDSSRPPSDFSSLMTSNFDSSTTFAGASEFTSVSTSVSQLTGSILDGETWLAPSEHGRRHQRQSRHSIGSSTADERASTYDSSAGPATGRWTRTGSGWTKLPLSEKRVVDNHDDQDNLTPPGRSRSSSLSQQHHHHRGGVVGGAGGVPRRNSRSRRYLEKQMSSQSSLSGASMFSNNKPTHLPRPLATPKRAAMSPHGVAMDAALKMVEERGARLGILREEGVSGTEKGGGRDLAYDNQIAAPAMTSLEQRRQRAKAWARSR